MFRCNRCGKYYVPGYLECECRVTSRRLRYPGVSKENQAKTLLFGAGKPAHAATAMPGASPPNAPSLSGKGGRPSATVRRVA